MPAPLLLWAQGIENKFNMLMDTVTGKRKETETPGVHSYPNKSARTLWNGFPLILHITVKQTIQEKNKLQTL